VAKVFAAEPPRFEAGSAARLDVLRAEVELSNAKAKLIRARSETDVAYQRLRTVLSLPQGEPLQLSGSLDEIPHVPSADAIETALGSRADIRSIGQQREAAWRLVSVANAEMKPIVAFSGNYQYQEDGLSSLLQGSNRSYQFGLNFTVPLFNAPTVAARRGAAAAQVKQADECRAQQCAARRRVGIAGTRRRARDRRDGAEGRRNGAAKG
jgi:outer membrane protein